MTPLKHTNPLQTILRAIPLCFNARQVPLLPRFGPKLRHWRTFWPANATFSPIFVPVAVLPAFEGPRSGPSAPVSASFRLQRSIPWTLSACFGAIPAPKVHPLDPQRLFRGYSGSKGPPTGPSATVSASFRLRRSTHWTLSATCGRTELVGNTVIIWYLRKILGANGAEDY